MLHYTIPFLMYVIRLVVMTFIFLLNFVFNVYDLSGQDVYFYLLCTWEIEWHLVCVLPINVIY